MLRPGRYYYNQAVYLTINVFDGSETDTDGTTVVLKTISPSGTEASYTYGTDANLTKTSTGDYTCIITATEPGRWYYRWEVTYSSQLNVEEGTFVVMASPYYDGLQDAYRS